MIAFLLLALSPVFAAVNQTPFTTGNFTTAPFIFNALSSLLTQWPNSYHANGHTVISGTLSPFTLLYHAHKNTQLPPPSPEWLAFDPEMSYAIMAASRGSPTYLLTYRNIKPARVVYFDGMSSALDSIGWLDTQEVLVSRKGKKGSQGDKDIGWYEDYDRADRLCKWGTPRGVEGFIRMNAGL